MGKVESATTRNDAPRRDRYRPAKILLAVMGCFILLVFFAVANFYYQVSKPPQIRRVTDENERAELIEKYSIKLKEGEELFFLHNGGTVYEGVLIKNIDSFSDILRLFKDEYERTLAEKLLKDFAQSEEMYKNADGEKRISVVEDNFSEWRLVISKCNNNSYLVEIHALY